MGGHAGRVAVRGRRYSDAMTTPDHVRCAAALDGVRPDPRPADAIELVRSRRQPRGTRPQQVHHSGQEWFTVDVPVGEPSPRLTPYATRGLRWWDDNAGEEQS